MKKRNKIYFYPSYFDSEKSRNEGRRVSKKLAIKSPTLEMLENSAASLGYQFEVEIEKAYPKCWWTRGRLAIVNPTEKKTKILIKLSKDIKRSKI